MDAGLEYVLLIFRVAFIALLYAFLSLLAVFIWRDGRRSPDMAIASFKVVDAARSGLANGARLALSDDTSIGRSSSNVIQIADDSISSHHAMVRFRDGHWQIEDVGSTNGTRVNGAPITRPTLLRPNDAVEVGRVRLVLEAKG